MEIGRQHFQQCGSGPPSARWPVKGKPSSPAQRRRSRRTHRRRCTRSAKSIVDSISALGPGLDSTVLHSVQEALQGKEVSGQPAGNSPNERVEEAKARVARLASCWGWTVQSRSQSFWRRREDKVVFSRRTSRLLFKIRRQRTRSKTTDRGLSGAGVVGQVRVAGCPGVGRSGTPSRRRLPLPAGNNIEELAVLRREVDQLRRERDVWLGKTQPTTIDGHVHASRSSRMADLIDEADARRRCVDVPSTIANCAL